MTHKRFLHSHSYLNLCSEIILNLLFLQCLWTSSCWSLYSNQFAIHVPNGEAKANEICEKHGFVNLGQVLWFEQQVEKKRVKRDFRYFQGNAGPAGPGPFYSGAHSFPSPYQTGFSDPLWKEQWYLNSGSKDGFDMNVQAAWKRGFTGKRVVVSILDDGIQSNHPDLQLNYDPKASTDINDNDNDPFPQDNGDNKHGTRCAGEVAATAGNNICGVGVAYNASIGGVRMLDGVVNDAVEAKALGLNPDHIDIYSASWGPEDDGKTVDGPGPLARRAFIYGVTNGRKGLGSIFIWASGNGGRHVDSCNCDGYTNSIFTLSISSATQGGFKPWYLEECASTLATTYSSGTPTLDKSVATVDMDGRLRADHICTVEHTGTSASAPIAAGIAALALEANPNLTWRDMQHLVVITSRPQPLDKEEGWFVNGVQRKFSHKFGYGLMDASKLVDQALKWNGVPPQHICKSREIKENKEIPGAHLGKVKVFMDVDGCAGTNSEIRYLEHVQCKISLRFFPRGNLRILLTSPMGTTSVLLFERPRDVSSSNFDDWPFLSVHFWGEQAHGRWTLEIINSGTRRINQPGILKKWQLILYGTDINPVQYRSRALSQPSFNEQFRVPASHHREDDSSFGRHDYLFPGASENIPLIAKPHMVRSNCQNEYWIPDLSICVNDCPEGFYADMKSMECHSCPQHCKSCNDAMSCAACEHGLALFESKCVASCPKEYFEVDATCEMCPVQNCSSCTGAMGEECIRCKSPYLIKENACVRQCGRGYYSTENNECVKCSVGCASCDSTHCSSCQKGFELDSESSTCIFSNPVCPAGLFYETSSKSCIECGVSHCTFCKEDGECVQCDESHLLLGGLCVPDCGSGYFASESSKECIRCPKLCSRCNSRSECLECVNSGVLQEGSCRPHCSDGFYKDLGTCNVCSDGCETCIGPTDAECISCKSGLRLSKSGQCFNANSIVKLETLKRNITCPDGFWFDNRQDICQECHSSCSKCTGPLDYHCRKCVAPLRLDIGTSRCLDCCQSAENTDCCHCENDRHPNAFSPHGRSYTGECHFVSRRVSMPEENDSGKGSINESIALSAFWLCVFVVAVSVVVTINKRTKSVSSPLDSSLSNSDVLYPHVSIKSHSCDTNSHSSVKYTPLSLGEEDDLYDVVNSYESSLVDVHDESNEQEDLVQDNTTPNHCKLEGIPHILKT